MKHESDQPEAPVVKSGSRPDAKDDLKVLPMPELQANLGSSPDGLSQAEAQKRLTQFGPNECETLRVLLFIGSRRIARSGKIEN
jgi:H+-transporting ATPase